MASLAEKLTDPAVRPKVVQACVDLVEHEVSAKKGLGGTVIKAGFAVIKKLKPGMVPAVVDNLLPDFAAAMQPIYDRSTDGASDKTQAFSDYIKSHRDETADALLSVTDAKAQRAANKTIKSTYDKLRGTARDNVSAAVPGLADALRPYL